MRGSDVDFLFNKKFSSFALFQERGFSDKELVAHQNSPNYKPGDQDKNLLMALSKWSTQHKIEVEEDQWMLFVWDGTDTPPVSVDTKSYTERISSKGHNTLHMFPLAFSHNRVRLTLEDSTARIHAFLYAEDGTMIFGDSGSVNMLTRKKNMLLGVSNERATTLINVSRNPP